MGPTYFACSLIILLFQSAFLSSAAAATVIATVENNLNLTKENQGESHLDDSTPAGNSRKVIPTGKNGPKKVHEVTAALNQMLEEYDKRIRPNFYGPPVQVGITIFVNNLVSVSEYDMEYKLEMYFRQFWRDDRLQFNLTNPLTSEKIGVLQLGHEFSQKIWQPDTFFPNEKSSYLHTATVENELLRLHEDGKILKSVRLTLTAACSMDLKFFPMDRQICSIEIESYGHAAGDIIYNWKDGNKSVALYNGISLPQFRVMGHRQRSTTIGLTTGQFSRLQCDVLFVRSFPYYIIQVYVPAGLIVIISWLALWMEREASIERMALGVTTVLTITTLLISTNANSPKISYIKALDLYLVICFANVFASLLQSATLGYLGKRLRQQWGEKKKINKKNIDICNFNHPQMELRQNQHHHQHNESQVDQNRKRTIQTQTVPSFIDIQPKRSGDLGSSVGGRVVNPHHHQSDDEDEYDNVDKRWLARMDIVARILFPFGFTVFNIFYWRFYLDDKKQNVDDTWVLME